MSRQEHPGEMSAQTLTIQRRTAWGISRIRTLLHTNDGDLESSSITECKDIKTRHDNLIRDFLSAVSGKHLANDVQLTLQQRSYIDYIKLNLANYPRKLFAEILHGPNKAETVEIDAEEIFVLLISIARVAQDGGQFSIETALNQAVAENILHEDTLHPPLRQQTLSVLFSCVAWISMFYTPGPHPALQYEFITVDRSECMCIIDSQPISNTRLPLCELIQGFGPVLPTRRDSIVPNVSDSVFSAESLYVSLLNASTLVQVGGIQIQWITNVSSHLAFDPETQTLMMFALPSFCRFSEDESSTFAKIVSSYYDEFNLPQDFSGSAFLKEVRRTYQLIFSNNPTSSNYYKKHERKKLLKKGSIDPYLDELCQINGHRKRKHQASYSKATDFPILAVRLAIIQEYIQRQNPDTVAMLWRDKRNLLQWYTFWAVTIIGTIGIVLSIVQTFLAAAQVYYSKPR